MVNVTCHRLARDKVTFAKCVRRDGGLRHATSRVTGRRPTPVARATSSDAPRDLGVGTHSHARTGLNLNFHLCRENGRIRKSGKFH